MQLSLMDAIAAAPPTLPRGQRNWHDIYILEDRVAAGKVGPTWKQGGKVHLVRYEVVVAHGPNAPKSQAYKVGSTFSAYSPCNSNGQHIARPEPTWSLDLVSCINCRKAIGAHR